MICNCGKTIEEPRVEFGLKICASCARKADTPKVKGVLRYSHKTGGEIQIMSEECFNSQKKYWTPQGAHSAVKNFSKSTSC
jgi:hypothetical protein|tara:strand:- start:800 stop:1042 length:243 start_codon:yes stop_codon:yes gene_type:complete